MLDFPLMIHVHAQVNLPVVDTVKVTKSSQKVLLADCLSFAGQLLAYSYTVADYWLTVGLQVTKSQQRGLLFTITS